jgi:hypothetical protein
MKMRSLSLPVLVLVVVVAGLVWYGARPRALPLAVHTIRADDNMLRQVKALGADSIVQVFSWHDIQPSPHRWEWEYTDWLVRAAEHYELEVIPRLDKPPPWAVSDSRALSSPPLDNATFAQFARRVAERYRGRIKAYIVWNEPNLAIEWGNQEPDAAAFAKLLKAATDSIRETDSDARVIAGALAPTNEVSQHARDDRLYLQDLYAAGARDAFDVLAAHPYAFAQPPSAPPTANNGLNFARIYALRGIMQAQGDAAKPIWITEFGYPTVQPPGYEDRVVSAAEQAEYLPRAYAIARDDLHFVELFTVWNLVRDLPETDEQAGYSLLNADGSYKPAFDSVGRIEKEPRISGLATFLADLAGRLPIFTAIGSGRRAPLPTEYPILARDVVVHLGDSEYPAPFFPLYNNNNPAVDWKGDFYLRQDDLARGGTELDWSLLIELMQVNDLDTRIWVNDVPLEPAFLPAEDFTSRWVTAHLAVPRSALRLGHNAVSIRNGKLLPPFQQAGFTWDEFQFRNVQLVPP